MRPTTVVVYLKYLSKLVKKHGRTDGTVYGSSPLSTRSSFVRYS